MLMRIKSQKFQFQTVSQSEIALKIAKRSKYGNFNFVVEYPIWVSINRTLTGKLAIDCQNFIWCVRFEENVQKSSKKLIPEKANFLMVFGCFLLTERSK